MSLFVERQIILTYYDSLVEYYPQFLNQQEVSDLYRYCLEQGSLLLMKGKTQQYFEHEIPKMMAVKTPRISLTWRMMLDN